MFLQPRFWCWSSKSSQWLAQILPNLCSFGGRITTCTETMLLSQEVFMWESEHPPSHFHSDRLFLTTTSSYPASQTANRDLTEPVSVSAVEYMTFRAPQRTFSTVAKMSGMVLMVPMQIRVWVTMSFSTTSSRSEPTHLSLAFPSLLMMEPCMVSCIDYCRLIGVPDD